MSSSTPRKKVLLTGAAGRIGTYLRERLSDSFEFSGIDRLPVERLDSTVANLTDYEVVLGAAKGNDVIVHLAAEPRHTPDIWWDVLLPDNIIATANVFEAARQSSVARVVFFSSMHVVGMYEQDEPWASIANGEYGDLDPADVPLVTHDMPVRPDGPYAASKIFGESLGRYYSEDFGMTVICIRLGTMGGDDKPGDDARSRVSWLSRRDLATMVQRCIEVEGIGYDIFYGASANTWKIYDTPRAWETLGYRPKDNAESFAG
ncbi:MAG: NAD(P)-dependent oxidoreductase [SAR202 cluster bacterium]|jgi:nucleoside-diphosphate-sugar epimerase|nr:NAD(P)-dependent oxidoreductase [SAR202 cluster bacterium]|tara:strand:- start:1555 stop:2337 length:783 start_codon:yes stop_codon:yes gene_type:complete